MCCQLARKWACNTSFVTRAFVGGARPGESGWNELLSPERLIADLRVLAPDAALFLGQASSGPVLTRAIDSLAQPSSRLRCGFVLGRGSHNGRARCERRLRRVSFEFAVALDGNQDGAHLVALGEDDLLEFALFELVEQAVQLAHPLADGRELGVGDSDALPRFAYHARHDIGRCGRIADGSVGLLSALSETLRLR